MYMTLSWKTLHRGSLSLTLLLCTAVTSGIPNTGPLDWAGAAGFSGVLSEYTLVINLRSFFLFFFLGGGRGFSKSNDYVHCTG